MEEEIQAKETWEKDLSSRAKAAILIRMFTPETAQKVVKYLTPEEKEILIQEIAIMPDYDKLTIEIVMQNYLNYFRSRNIGITSNGIEYVKELFKDLPEKDLERMLGRIYYDVENPFEFLTRVRDMEPLLALLDGEDPQTIAIVASYLAPQQAAQLVQSLPEEKMLDTVMGIARLDQIDNEILARMSTYLNKKMDNLAMGDQNKADGIKTIVGILNNVSRGTEKTVFERLDAIDEALAQEIRDNMFTFDDLVKLDNLTLQKVLSVIDVGTLARAMKVAKEELKEKIFANLSEGKRDSLNEELDAMGGVRVTDIETAQQNIATKVKEMEKEGKIEIVRSVEDVIY